MSICRTFHGLPGPGGDNMEAITIQMTDADVAKSRLQLLAFLEITCANRCPWQQIIEQQTQQ